MDLIGNMQLNEVRRAANVQRQYIVGVRQKCIDLKKVSVFLQPVEARKIAPEVDEALFQAYRTIDYLIDTINKMEENHRLQMSYAHCYEPAGYTKIEGREGFKWQVKL